MSPWAIATPIGAALLGIALGFALSRWVAGWVGWSAAALGLGAAVGLAWRAESLPGMEGLAQFVLALLVIAPASLGAALGALLALARARRR